MSPKVWDPLLRILHWSLVATVLGSWITRHGFGRVHEWWGYTALAVIIVRFFWGFAGSRHARFSGFIRSPRVALSYFKSIFQGNQSRYIGHNPLGGWMAVALWFMVAAVCFSGWLYTTDRFWGIAWVETLHGILTNVLLGLVVLHVAGVLVTSWHTRENLVASMLHGRKRPAGPNDVD